MMSSNPNEGACMSKIRHAIDEALRSRLRLQEVKAEALLHQCQGLETAEVERTVLEATLESQRAIQALNAQLLTAEG